MKVTLKDKLLFLVLLPHLAIVFLAGEAILKQIDTRNSLKMLVPIERAAIKASSVIHELQKERGLIAGFISSGFSPRAQAELERQIDPSNEALDTFVSAFKGDKINQLPPRLIRRVTSSLKGISTINDHRDKVKRHEVTIDANSAFYTEIIEGLIFLASNAADQSPLQALTEKLLPYVALIKAKEHAGLERALGSAVLHLAARGEYDPELYSSYKYQLLGEKLLMQEFNRFAKSELRNLFQETVRGSAVEKVKKWRKILAEVPQKFDNQNLRGAQWFEAATERIGLFKTLEDLIAKDIDQTTLELIDQANTEIYMIVGVNLLIVLIFAFIGVSGALPIASRIGVFVHNIQNLADGKIDVPLVNDKQPDDIGKMNRALVKFKDNILKARKLEEGRLNDEKEAKFKREKALKNLSNAIEQRVEKSVGAISAESQKLVRMASDLSSVTGQASEGVIKVSSAAEQSSMSASSVTEVVEKMNFSVQEVVRSVGMTRTSAEQATLTARETAEIVSRLESVAGEVGAVVGLISDIAEQTNLLALNATIEASRAGDAGKGFAVVASEVKSLANQTSSSAADISTQMDAMQSTTREAVAAMEKIAGAIQDINSASVAIDGAVDEQKELTNSIGHNASESSHGAQDVLARVNDIRENLEKVNNFAQEVSDFSSELQGEIKGLQEEVRNIRSNSEG